MNIKEAKQQIQNTITAYLSKNEYGDYDIPLERQRPVFLVGPPGIGKTAIIEQIAQELGVAMVSYSMTHHTRQSALGLPFIVHKTYGDREYDVSEYTMSEIISSVYDKMEETGLQDGILFLDEINCVSETLTPAMLQFLQYKVFGRHQVPNGWIVVTAGNPPEYNHSVREFDIVTLDRLKRIDVEPDYGVWKEHAYRSNVHPAITTYLEIKKNDFYEIETTIDGKRFVTARAWSDLSDIMRVYEKLQFPVDEKLVSQYLQNQRIARDFSIYYDLFRKYRADYQTEQILAGQASDEVVQRAKDARFDERLSLIGLLLEQVTTQLKAVCQAEQALTELLGIFKTIRIDVLQPGWDALKSVETQMRQKRAFLEAGKKSGTLSLDALHLGYHVLSSLEQWYALLAESTDAMICLKKAVESQNQAVKQQASDAGVALSNVFRFCETAFGDGQELMILVTELTIHPHSARFISRYGCPEYYSHNKNLLLQERQKELLSEIDQILG